MVIKPDRIGVHINHCCILHGCKYGDEDCPVENGEYEQEFLCEYCDDSGIKTLNMLKEVVAGKRATCPHCGHVV